MSGARATASTTTILEATIPEATILEATIPATTIPPTTIPGATIPGAPDSTRIRQALRELSRSGRRLVQRREAWIVTTTGRGCQLARLTQAEVAMLAADQRIEPAQGGGYILCVRIGDAPRVAVTMATRAAKTVTRGATLAETAVETAVETGVEETPLPPLKPPPLKTGPWLFEAIGIPRPARLGAGFAGLALRARAGEGPMTLRQALAGLQLIADAEQSLRGMRITMDWDAAAADGRRRRGRDGGLAHAARAACARLARAKAAVGDDAWALAWGACIDRASVQTLAKRRGAGRADTRNALCVALEKLAAAYDAA